MSTTSEEIPQLLKNLRLRKMAAILETELAAARKSSPSYSDFLVRLLQAEWLNQQERKLQARIKRANFPEIWTRVRSVAQGTPEWLSRSVHPSPGSVRGDVCLTRRSCLAEAHPPSGWHRYTARRRALVS